MKMLTIQRIMNALIACSVAMGLICLPACKQLHKGEHHDHAEEAHGHDHDHEGHDHDHDEEETIVTVTTEQMQQVHITLGAVEQKDLTATLSANGLLKVPNTNRAKAVSLSGGVVQRLMVRIGDHVCKGQVLATVANPQFVQMQEEYVTTLDKEKLAEQELKRQKALTEGNAGMGKNLERATAEYNMLRSRRVSLSKQLQLVGINVQQISSEQMEPYVPVVSPIAGVVSNVWASVGSYVDGSIPVAEVVDNSSLHLDLQVFEKDLAYIKEGQTVHFTLTNNPVKEYDATVYSIGSSFENESKTIAVHCSVQGDKQGLIDGMNVTGVISLSQQLHPAVPKEAIVESNGKNYIFVVTKADDVAPTPQALASAKTVTFEKIEVVTGVLAMGYTAVTFVHEKPEGQPIAVSGAFFLNAKLTNTGGHEH